MALSKMLLLGLVSAGGCSRALRSLIHVGPAVHEVPTCSRAELGVRLRACLLGFRASPVMENPQEASSPGQASSQELIVPLLIVFIFIQNSSHHLLGAGASLELHHQALLGSVI